MDIAIMCWLQDFTQLPQYDMYTGYTTMNCALNSKIFSKFTIMFKIC